LELLVVFSFCRISFDQQKTILAQLNRILIRIRKNKPLKTKQKKPAQAPITSSKGTYESYGPEKIARAAQEKVILFFHAPWCPTCKRLDADIQKNSDKIPGGIVILKTDYDSEVALKQKYGVTYQHTFVQVDANGNLISKWSGSPTLSEFLEKVI
jgi:thiol-disulfide isomerase/thioredoxin